MQIDDGLLWRASRDTLYRLLQLCTSERNLAIGKKVHFSMVSKGLDTIPILKDHILRFYASCGNLPEAQNLFDSSNANLFAYNALMSAYAKHGYGHMTFQLLQRLLQSGLNPDKCTFLCILGVCCKTRDLKQGRNMHDWIIQENLVQNTATIQEDLGIKLVVQQDLGQNIATMEKFSGQNADKIQENSGKNVLDVAIANTVIDMYAKCGCLYDSYGMFDRLSVRNEVSWAAMIVGFSHHGDSRFVMKLFEDMQSYHAEPNAVVYSCVLKACCCLRLLGKVRQIHYWIVRARLELDDVVFTALVDAYAKCKSLEEAWKVFNEMNTVNVVTWNAMIVGFAQYGDDLSSLVLLKRLIEKGAKPDNVTFVSVLKACATAGNFEGGRITHHVIIDTGLRHDMTLENAMIDMYGKCGCMCDALTIFNKLPNPDVISWGAIINGYAENDQAFHALHMLELMQQQHVMPNEIIFMAALKACIGIGSTREGQRIHNQVVKDGLECGVFVGSTIIDMYVKCGNVEEATNCFERQIDLDVVSWGAMIYGHVEIGHNNLALDMFVEMLHEGIEPTEAIFVTILQACMNMDAIELGGLVHEYVIKTGLQIDGPIANTLVDMYGRCGSLEDAWVVFEANPNRDIAMWGAMIAVFVQHGQFFPALELFMRMQSQTIPPNRAILLSILKACHHNGTMIRAMKLHELIVETGQDSDVIIGNALVDLYTKCGSKSEANKVLTNLQNRDVVSWTAAISHTVEHEDGQLSMQYFDAMKHEGLKPDNAIFTNILAACCHEGMVEKGLEFFISMINEHKVAPDFRHFHALADLLVRSGLFEEACNLLGTMPESRNIIGWTSLLSGCKRYGNAEVGHKCFGAIADLVSKSAL